MVETKRKQDGEREWEDETNLITAELEAEIKGYIYAAGEKQTWGTPYVQDVHFLRNTCMSCPATKQLNQFRSDKPDTVLCPEEVVMSIVATTPTSQVNLSIGWIWCVLSMDKRKGNNKMLTFQGSLLIWFLQNN